MTKSRILVNSLPKSGTHLLAQAVELFGYREHFAETEDSRRATPIFFNYREARDALALEPASPLAEDRVNIGSLASCPVPLPVFRRWLDALPEGRYILGHVLFTPALPPLLAELNYRHVFIIRDPRAVVMSLMAFILDTGHMPRRHFLEADLKALPEARRLDFILNGGLAPEAGVNILPFAEAYRAVWAWREAMGCLFLRYEDLVGAAGGGSDAAQRQAMERLAEHLGAPPPENLAIYNPNSRTFRSGTVDGWRRHLDEAGLARLETALAPLCRELGYD